MGDTITGIPPRRLTHIAGEAGKNRQNSVHKRYFINNSGYGKMQYSGYQALING
jgi:hypothetical protein